MNRDMHLMEQELYGWALPYREKSVPKQLEECLKSLKAQYITESEGSGADIIRLSDRTGKNDKMGQFSAKNKSGKARTFTAAGRGIAVAAFICGLFILSVNRIPALAAAIGHIPILGTVANFVTFNAYQQQLPKASADIYSVKLEGMENEALQTGLNEKYAKQAGALFQKFMDRIDKGDSHIDLFSAYNVVGNNGITLSIDNVVFEAEASGVERHTYDTIDVVHQLYLTLPSLFTEDTYVERISEVVSEQIKERVAAGEMFYEGEEAFKSISPNQQFYITNQSKLTIVFDEYAIAPGVMGVVYFEIPTEEIRDLLASERYIN
jgi:hypothetical protein